MEYNDLAKIENLVHNLWDAAALFCLEHRSLRYSELHREMAAWSGEHLSEAEMTRARHRLVRRHLIRQEPGGNGHQVYSITQAGRVRLGQIRILIQIAPHLDAPTDDQKPDDHETPEPGESAGDENLANGENQPDDETPRQPKSADDDNPDDVG